MRFLLSVAVVVGLVVSATKRAEGKPAADDSEDTPRHSPFGRARSDKHPGPDKQQGRPMRKPTDDRDDEEDAPDQPKAKKAPKPTKGKQAAIAKTKPKAKPKAAIAKRDASSDDDDAEIEIEPPKAPTKSKQPASKAKRAKSSRKATQETDDESIEIEGNSKVAAKGKPAKAASKSKAHQESDDESIEGNGKKLATKGKPAKATANSKPAAKSHDDDGEAELEADDDKASDKKLAAKGKSAKPTTSKGSRSHDDADDEELDDETSGNKVAAKSATTKRKPASKSHDGADDEELDDETTGNKVAAKGKSATTKRKPAPKSHDGADDVDDQTSGSKIAAKGKSAKSTTSKGSTSHGDADDEELEDDEATTRPASADGATKQSAKLDDDDDGEELADVPTKVTASVGAKPRKTRFYFRAGGFKSQTKLGSTKFTLETDLPIDTSNLGAGSGVELDQKQIPVGVIVGFVLPVLHRKLSIETILGFPTPTKFRATGALATDSLAPTFMGAETGIQPLGPDLAEATFTTPVVTAVYRVAKLGPVTPIAGAGVMVLMARNAKVTNAVLDQAGDPKLKISPSPGLALQGGFDIHLFGRIALRLEAKTVLGMKVKAKVENIAVTPTAIPTLGSIEVGDALLAATVTPFVVQAGIGADF